MNYQNFYLKLVKFFYSIPGELSEELYLKLATFGNNVYMALIAVIFGGFLAEIWFDTTVIAYGIFWTLFIALVWQESYIQKMGLDKLYVGKQDLAQARKYMFRKTLKQTLMLEIYSLVVLLLLWKSHIPQESGTPADVYFGVALPGVLMLSTIIGFLSYYVSNRRKIMVTE